LYITEDVPNRDPVYGDGSSMISFEVLRALPESVSVTLLTFAGNVEVPAVIGERCERVWLLPKRGHLSASALSAVSRYSIGGAERATREFKRAIRRLSTESDVTLLHGPHATPLTHQVRGPLVMQVVDPWSMRATTEVALARGLRARYRVVKVGQALALERRIPRHARLLTVGRKDAATWEKLLDRPVRSIANGADDRVDLVRRPSETPTVCFVGSLSYGPNVDSAHRLVQEVAPIVWAHLPQTRFVVAGRQPDPSVLALASAQVEILPNVSSVFDVFAGAHVACFPDLHGLGVRNSVREAISCGIPVVASASAAREQPPHPLLRIAEDIRQLAHLVVAALEEPLHEPGLTASSAVPATRPWGAVAQEYAAECYAALGEHPSAP